MNIPQRLLLDKIESGKLWPVKMKDFAQIQI